ncbi:hypothetical protein BH24GEM2_BH24GEM2_17540 [soil metagenome]
MRHLMPQRFLVLVLALIVTSCSEPLDFSQVIRTGRIMVQVTSAEGEPVADVPLVLLRAGTGTLWRTGRTGSDGTGEIAPEDGGVLWGDYLLKVTPPAEYFVDPTRSHPIPFRLQGDQITLEVVLVRKSS